MQMGVTTICKVLAEKYQLRSRGPGNLGRGPIPAAQIPQLTQSVDEWLRYYHYQRPHLSLGMRPPCRIPCDISK